MAALKSPIQMSMRVNQADPQSLVLFGQPTCNPVSDKRNELI